MKSTVAPYATAAWCVRIVCIDGPTLRLTTYPFDLTMSNATVYETDSGYEQTAYSSGTGMAPAAIDIDGFVGVAGITRDQIASGVFDNARVYIFKCDWLNPVEDYEPITSGFFGKTKIEDDRYKIEGLSLSDVLNQTSGRTFSPVCSHTFGDAKCGIDLAAIDVVGAVTSITSDTVFRDSSRSEAADWFGAGYITFTSGDNVGLPALEIKTYAADGTITTHRPPYYPLTIGTTFTMVPGCRKRKEDCRDKWDNVINAFAFWDMPPTSAYLKRGGI